MGNPKTDPHIQENQIQERRGLVEGKDRLDNKQYWDNWLIIHMGKKLGSNHGRYTINSNLNVKDKIFRIIEGSLQKVLYILIQVRKYVLRLCMYRKSTININTILLRVFIFRQWNYGRYLISFFMLTYILFLFLWQTCVILIIRRKYYSFNSYIVTCLLKPVFLLDQAVTVKVVN